MIKFLVALTLFTATIFAGDSEEVKSLLQSKIDIITTILKDSKIDTTQKEVKIINSVEDTFDFELMAKLSLGKDEWTKISTEERKTYIDLFVKKVKNSYFEKLNSYSNEKIELQNAKEAKGRIFIPTLIIGNGEPTEVTYKFYRGKDKNWLIYDLEIAGVSIIQTYRTQFAEILTTNSFKTLIEKLRI